MSEYLLGCYRRECSSVSYIVGFTSFLGLLYHEPSPIFMFYLRIRTCI